ncbi:MAG TPA: fibronectin type III domain-containing protein [Kiritimatiellia bacterium]|nr:fibronectin type III domain-containing protein [Kiritimatiellia bacterium]
MKRTGTRLAVLALAAMAWAGVSPVVRGELSPLFTLDTRTLESGYTALFVLDTRDPDAGMVSGLFTLDTRGELPSQSGLFTLDTRDPDRDYAPENLAVAPEQLTVARATWEYNGTPSGFVLERRPPLGDWQWIAGPGGSARTWADTTVEPGRFYEYRIAAVLPGGVSDYSETAYIQMPSLPAAPPSLAATWMGGGTVMLTWQDLSKNEDGFEVWRREGDADWTALARTGADATGLLDEGVQADSLYAYKVRAFNAWGNSGFSAEASVSTTDSEGGGCGYLLCVDGAALTLDGVAVDSNSLNQADSRALVQGGLAAWIRSPTGNAHPVRVVLGFRDAQGAAAGTPVELEAFCLVPGCPGISVTSAVPEAFRAPESGTNTLWIEMIMAQRDPVEAFLTERHTQESPMRKRLFDANLRPANSTETRVRILDAQAVPGTVVNVPVELISTGGEHQVSFSVAFDGGVTWTGLCTGEDAPQLRMQTVEDESGAVGVTALAPAESPLGAGSKHLATLQFLAGEGGGHVLHFQDLPAERSVDGRSGVEWTDGMISVADAGLEGDIHPRPGGDGVVDGDDAHMALLIALGMADLPVDGQEFQRLDCAPIATCGDGCIDIADKVAILRYANGQEATKAACGPTNLAAEARPAGAVLRDAASRVLSISAPGEVQRGETFPVQIVLDTDGGEHALSASLAFDPDELAYAGIQVLDAATNGVFLPNVTGAAEGSIAIGLELADTQVYAAGRHALVEITFVAVEGGGTLETLLAFASAPSECRLAGLGSESLAADYLDASVNLVDWRSGAAAFAPGSGQAVALSMQQIKVSWTAVASATGYRVRRRLEGETAWTRLADFDAERTVFVDDGLPAGTRCQYLVTSLNPNGEESSAIRLQASTWTALEAWRMDWLGQIENEGDAADGADPDGDGIPNRLEYALGTDPMGADATPFSLAREEIFPGSRSLTVSYTTGPDASGQLTFEFTEDLLETGTWRSNGLAPVSLRRDAGVDFIKLRLPEDAGAGRMIFLRMKAE